jgi:catechol-2,3-dioxygenase
MEKKINSGNSNEIYKNKETKRWSSEDKSRIVIETYSLNKADLATYCRQKGLYVEQVPTYSNLIHTF